MVKKKTSKPREDGTQSAKRVLDAIIEKHDPPKKKPLKKSKEKQEN